MENNQFMRAGIDIQGLVWLVVIVASIVGQMMKTAKKHRDAAPGSPAAPRPDQPAGGEPAQELEDFLRNLMGEQTPRSTPPPVPAPMREAAPEELPRRSKPEPSYYSATTSPTVAPRAATAEPPVIVHRPPRHAYRAVPVLQPPPRPSPVPVRSPPAYSLPPLAQRPLVAALPPIGIAPLNKAVVALREEVRRQAKTPIALRSALLMREILGPPIGLRDLCPPR